MSRFEKKAKDNLRNNIPDNFKCLLTGIKPYSEDEFSSLLSIYHQLGKIEWKSIPLLRVKDCSLANMNMASIFADEGVVSREWPLFIRNWDEGGNKWGEMKPDLIYISNDIQSVCFLENKFGDLREQPPKDGQLALYLDYLLELESPNKYFILLSGKEFFDKGWYNSELHAAIEHKSDRINISSYLIMWEDVFASINY